MTQIELVISPEGQTRITPRGFQGASCREADAFLRQALGVVTQERLTPEFHAVATTITQQESLGLDRTTPR